MNCSCILDSLTNAVEAKGGTCSGPSCPLVSLFMVFFFLAMFLMFTAAGMGLPVMFRSVFLPPAYVVRREGNSFTLFVCPHLGGGDQVSQGGSGQSPAGGGLSPADRGGGQSAGGGVSILRPLAGGMPLAFTQEDFLV